MPRLRQQPAGIYRHRAGFTLVEIALAVGIFAFAIVAIMALFPVGLRSASDSRVETIVTQIARTVLSDLRTGEFRKARIVIKPLPEAGITPTSEIKEFNLSENPPAPVCLLYQSDARVIREVSLAQYNGASSDGDFLVKIESRLVIATDPKLAQVTVTVEAPAAAVIANRTKYPVVTLMGDTR